MRFILTLYTVLYLFLTSIEYILYTRWSLQMKNYQWYAYCLIFPISSCVICWIPVLSKRYLKKYHFDLESEFPKKRLIAISICDWVNFIINISIPSFLSMFLTTLLNNIVLPLTLLLSYFYLKTIYKLNHFLGAFLIIYGVTVGFIPDFDNLSKNQGNQGNQGNQENYNKLGLGIYIISLGVVVFNYCYKDT